MAHLQNGFGLLPPNIVAIPLVRSLDKPLVSATLWHMRKATPPFCAVPLLLIYCIWCGRVTSPLRSAS